jgi:hypothetical protein
MAGIVPCAIAALPHPLSSELSLGRTAAPASSAWVGPLSGLSQPPIPKPKEYPRSRQRLGVSQLLLEETEARLKLGARYEAAVDQHVPKAGQPNEPFEASMGARPGSSIAASV